MAGPFNGTYGMTPWGAIGASAYQPGACATTNFYSLGFPAVDVSQAWLFNRKDCCDTRPWVNGYRAQLLNGGTVSESLSLMANSTVIVRSFATPFNAPVTPDPTSAQQVNNRPNWARYVRLTTTVASIINLREIMVFDSTGTNVARGKRCYHNDACFNTGTCCDKAVDHIVDMDATSANILCVGGGRGAIGRVEIDALYVAWKGEVR